MRLPIDQQGLTIQQLHTEARVAALPADHRLAGKGTISIADLADEHLLQGPNAVPEWRDIATELRTRTRRPAPFFHSVEESLNMSPQATAYAYYPVCGDILLPC